MNTTSIIAAAKEIDRLETGLKWLREFGVKLEHREKTHMDVAIRGQLGGSCVGAPEANEMMSAAARVMIQEIVAHAIRDAENTIEIHKATLRRQVAESLREALSLPTDPAQPAPPTP